MHMVLSFVLDGKFLKCRQKHMVYIRLWNVVAFDYYTIIHSWYAEIVNWLRDIFLMNVNDPMHEFNLICILNTLMQLCHANIFYWHISIAVTSFCIAIRIQTFVRSFVRLHCKRQTILKSRAFKLEAVLILPLMQIQNVHSIQQKYFCRILTLHKLYYKHKKNGIYVDVIFKRFENHFIEWLQTVLTSVGIVISVESFTSFSIFFLTHDGITNAGYSIDNSKH